LLEKNSTTLFVELLSKKVLKVLEISLVFSLETIEKPFIDSLLEDWNAKSKAMNSFDLLFTLLSDNKNFGISLVSKELDCPSLFLSSCLTLLFIEKYSFIEIGWYPVLLTFSIADRLSF
jgi:hypothetical protein